MFILRTTQMPTLAQLRQLEQIVAVDNAGINLPVSAGIGRACVVGETLQGPFTPLVVNTPSDISNIYMGNNPNRFTLLSQSGVDPSSAVQDGSGGAFDGNVWAELKGKTFTGLVIQRVDCDMVVANSSVAKAFIAFTVTVNADDITSGKLNKDIVIPSGTRFADDAIGVATAVVATSQQITIPTGTTCGGSFTLGISFTQDAATGALTYVTSGATTGATAFFVKGTTLALAALDTVIDGVAGSNPLPGVNVGTVIATSGISTINAAASATAIFAPAAGGAAPSPDTLSNRITLNYAAAILKTQPGVQATNDILAIWSARNYQTNGMTPEGGKAMRANLWANAIASSQIGRGRVACVTAHPALGIAGSQATTAKGVYTGLVSSDGITGADADRFWISGPFVQVFSQELNTDITISPCGARAAMKVNLFNAGKSEYQTSVGSIENASIQNIDAQEACFAANPLQQADYIALRAAGVAWLVKDRTAGWWFYSGVTAADQLLYNNRVADNRRSFADEVQDVIFGLAAPYSKKPGTSQRADAFTTDMTVYLERLVNPGIGDSRAKAQQVLDGAAAGNNDTLNGQGVYLFSASVQMYGDLNDIVINTMIGPTVIIAQVAPAT
jgi:hypothetical protein